jgi:dGTPase
LEERYGAFDGLNLMFETREGILKHCSAVNARTLGAIGQRFLDKKQPTLEAQLANLADEIAYNNHDIDDGLRSGLLSERQLNEVDLYARHRRDVEQVYPGISGRRAISETIRQMINALVVDLIDTSRERIRQIRLESVDDVRNAPPLIAFSPAMQTQATLLKQFLRENLYRHYLVNRMTSKARRIVTDLFTAFMAEPGLLSPDYESRDGDSTSQVRKIADYIAGMTDRYAIREHRRIFRMDEL